MEPFLDKSRTAREYGGLLASERHQKLNCSQNCIAEVGGASAFSSFQNAREVVVLSFSLKSLKIAVTHSQYYNAFGSRSAHLCLMYVGNV